MTELQILKYAYHGLLEIWSREYDRYQAQPDNEFTRLRYEKYDKELEELRAKLIAEEEGKNV